ncbi:MAG TPA: response regulator [Bryobacteraceae bacterium]|nr:response regulator [Bryobacteraceae bacterium]
MRPLGEHLRYILLAEDNPADVALVRVALEDRAVDCELELVSDGQKAMEFLDQLDADSKLACPSLFLLDLHLPKHDGVEVMIRLRASPRCGRTPVVILTSSDSPQDMEDAERHAALHYFRKPCSLDEFLALGDIVKRIMDEG